jgi:hypothetical protein
LGSRNRFRDFRKVIRQQEWRRILVEMHAGSLTHRR